MKRLLYVVLLIAAASVVPVEPAQASGACSGTSGVTVVVQFKDEPAQVGCAQGDPANGYQALREAGFAITNVQGQPQAICTINGQPDLANETCWGKTNFWAYWHGKAGAGWAWATTGASYNPKPGDFEGWHFGSGRSAGGPDYQLPAAPKPTATPTSRPTSQQTSQQASQQTGQPNSVSTARPSGAAGVRTDGGAPAGPDASSAVGTGSSSTTDPSSSRTATDAGEPAASGAGRAAATGPISPRVTKSGSSSAGTRSWLWGVLLIGSLGAAATTTAVRRRRG